MVTTGMRRGEVLGLRWSDVDLEAGVVTIRSTRIRYATTVATSTPKTAKGNRTIALGPAVTAALRAWRKAQTEDRLKMGAGWQNAADLVVALADGSPPNPASFSNLFAKLANRAGVRPIRLHDLRHSYATSALAADVPIKVVSQRLGHADVGVTLKVYAHVMPGDDAAAAAAAAADALIYSRSKSSALSPRSRASARVLLRETDSFVLGRDRLNRSIPLSSRAGRVPT